MYPNFIANLVFKLLSTCINNYGILTIISSDLKYNYLYTKYVLQFTYIYTCML